MVQDALTYFNGDELSASVFINKYALRDKENNLLEQNPDQMHRRMAKEFARIEKNKFKKPLTENFIYECFKNFSEIIPQGSPMAGIGDREHYVSLSNCYLCTSPLDSYASIMQTDMELVQISKRRGGVGINLDNLRPAGTSVTNSARTSTGVVSFMERYSNSIREVGQNARRGALMLTLSIHHPEVLEFALAKKDKKKVTGANISVKLTDEFLKAVEEDKEYEQRWPVTGKAKIKKMVNAREVWKQIIYQAWESAEPGLLFWDNVIRESPADCYSKYRFNSVGTNPCSELILCELDSCRLLLLNLFGFVRNPFGVDSYFDFQAFYEKSQIAQRLMDDLIDLELEAIDRIINKINSDPEPSEVKADEKNLWGKIREKCELGRRTGTGITALGDTIAAVGLKYGSDESIKFAEEVYKTLKFGCYRASVDMAKELGPFPIWDKELEKGNPFLNRIKDETIGRLHISGETLFHDMQRYGRRNIALLTTAPAGSVSIEAGPPPYYQTSSGVEALFKTYFIRRKKINHSDENGRVDFVDEMGDKWQEYPVYHPKLKLWMDVTGETDITKSPYHGCCAEDIDWTQRVKLQGALSKHVDHSISSTVNLPSTVTPEEVAVIYETAWRSGCKGITVYRAGCRSGVLVEDTKDKINKTNAPKRPKDVICDIHTTHVKGEEFFVFVGLLNNEPYEVLAGTNGFSLPKGKKGVIKKIRRGRYDLYYEGELWCEDITSHSNDEQEAITRMTSTALRHGADINFVTTQLSKTKGEMHSFAKSVARTLKKYIIDGSKVHGEDCPNCKNDSLVRQEGCATCKNCGWSRCE